MMRALKMVALLIAVAACGLAEARPARAPTLSVSVAFACSKEHPGKPVTVKDVDGPLCLDAAPFLTQIDVESAERHHNSKGHPVLFLTFHSDAAMRELQITKKNIGKRVAISLNGKLISAPLINSASRLLYIDGDFTEAQAVALVTGFNQRLKKR